MSTHNMFSWRNKIRINTYWLKKKNNYEYLHFLEAALAVSFREIVKEYLVIILGSFSPVLHKNICCGYSLEVPH